MNCKDKGYEKGHVFKVVSGDGEVGRKIGSIVILKDDDGTARPPFWLTDGNKDVMGDDWCYIDLFKVKRIWPPENDKVSITCEGKTVEISRESAKALNLI